MKKMKWWKIEKKSNYKKSLKLLKVDKNLIKYLTTLIPFIILEEDCIFVGYDETKNNIFNTEWIWHFELVLKDDDVYCGVFSIKNERKKKLKKFIDEN